MVFSYNTLSVLSIPIARSWLQRLNQINLFVARKKVTQSTARGKSLPVTQQGQRCQITLFPAAVSAFLFCSMSRQSTHQ
jgi:hypothetical protein